MTFGVGSSYGVGEKGQSLSGEPGCQSVDPVSDLPIEPLSPWPSTLEGNPMRANTVTGLAGGLVLAIAACTGNELPAGPTENPENGSPELSVVTFGLTTLGNPADNSAAQAINELGQILLTLGPEPFEETIWTNGSLLRLLHPFDARRVQGFDLNVEGEAVGDVDSHAAAWVNGELTLLQVPAEAVSSQAFAINDAGQIVGQAFLGVGQGPTPVLWQDKDSEMTPLPGGNGIARDINRAGEIVGSSVDEGRNFMLGAYWASPTAEPQFLKGPAGQSCAVPNTINDRSEIVGSCNGAAYWPTPTANAVVLDPDGFASQINELGQILGSHQDSEFNAHPTLWELEGTAFRAFDLGIVSGYEEGHASDISNHGQAVGSATRSFDFLGMLWQIPVRTELDVVPGAGSSIKVGGTGNVAAALLGSPWFHAADIDPNSLTLGNDNGTETPIARKKTSPVARLTDVNRDGNLDLVVEFPKQTMTRTGDLVTGSQVLVLQGRLRDGTRLRAADQVTGVR
jgi:uncharacterized membrane protein